MNEQKAKGSIRPTKKQTELLQYIEAFITEHGYSPSYREIMQGLNYTSVATVALHVNSLIKRGHLAKRDRSARSLEVLSPTGPTHAKVMPKQLKADEEKWLVDKVELFFKEAEFSSKLSEEDIDKLHVLCGALRVLGLIGASSAFTARLSTLKKRSSQNRYVA